MSPIAILLSWYYLIYSKRHVSITTQVSFIAVSSSRHHLQINILPLSSNHYHDDNCHCFSWTLWTALHKWQQSLMILIVIVFSWTWFTTLHTRAADRGTGVEARQLLLDGHHHHHHHVCHHHHHHHCRMVILILVTYCICIISIMIIICISILSVCLYLIYLIWPAVYICCSSQDGCNCKNCGNKLQCCLIPHWMVVFIYHHPHHHHHHDHHHHF